MLILIKIFLTIIFSYHADQSNTYQSSESRDIFCVFINSWSLINTLFAKEKKSKIIKMT